MSVKNDIIKRIMYHKDSMRDCEDHIRGIWEHYQQETRKGLDEYQLKDLLIWRKVEIAKAEEARNKHHEEKNWLAELLSKYA